MSPPGVSGQLRQLIHYHLDNGFHENALFLAERLHALDPRGAEACHLLALCNLRLGRYKAALEHARQKTHAASHLGCAYVFAQACLALERHDTGAHALERARGQWAARNHWNKHSDTSRRHVPDAAACFCLLGKLWSRHGDTKKAVDYYIEALKLNPFMWDAFTDLCNIGAFVRPVNIFRVTPEMLASMSHALHNGHRGQGPPQEVSEAANPFVATPDNDPFNPSRNGADVGLNLGGSNLLSKLNGSMVPAHKGMGAEYADVETPTSNGLNAHDDDIMMGDVGGHVANEMAMVMPTAPARKSRLNPFNPSEEPPKMRTITTRTRFKTGSESESTEIPRPIGQNGHKRTVSGHSMHHSQQPPAAPQEPAAPPRRSTRLLKSVRPLTGRLGTNRDVESKERQDLRKAKATGTKGKTATTSTVGRVVSGNRKPTTIEVSDAPSKPDSRPQSGASTASHAPVSRMTSSHDLAREREAVQWLLDLLLKFGTGYAQLSRFQCVEALETFSAIPVQQRETPWVLTQICKTYFERLMYAEAEKVFIRLRSRAPSHIEGMEMFSTVLWQLRKETDLAFLAHTLVDMDRLSPQAWCALGNAFSLQREHDQAIKCFTRATQLDPKFAYAFTLQGHEHISNEELDKAMFAYRCAISADARHYNGWYGLGQVYEKMGKFEVAEKHYRAAAQINPSNALLAIKIGSVLDRMKKFQPALTQYIKAVTLEPRSNMARFRKAYIHLKLNSPVEALEELEQLKDSAPDDANVHFLMGRVHQRLGDRASAVRCFTIALHLDPKAQMLIKERLDGLEEEEWSSEGER